MIAITETHVVLPTTGEAVSATAYKDRTAQGTFIRVVILLSALTEGMLEAFMKALVGTDASGIRYFLSQAKRELMLDPASGWFSMTEDQRERAIEAKARNLYEQATNRGFQPVSILQTTDGQYLTYSRKISVSDTYLRPLGATSGALIFTVSDETGKAIDLTHAETVTATGSAVTADPKPSEGESAIA